MVRVPLGQLLLQSGRLDHDQLIRALAHHQMWGGRLGEALVSLKFISEQDLLPQLARQHGVAYVQLGHRDVPHVIVRLVPQTYIRSRRVFPFALGPAERRGTLFIATEDPQNRAVLDEVAVMTGMAVRAVLVGRRDLNEVIERHLGEYKQSRPSDPRGLSGPPAALDPSWRPS